MPVVATRRYLLDTNILVYLIQGKQTGAEIATYFDLWNADVELQISVVTVGEILSFAKQNGWGQAKTQEMERLLNLLTRIDIHKEDVLQKYAHVDSHSYSNGKKMGKNDVWIAATASVMGLTLLTADGDFGHLNPVFLSLVHIDPATGRPRTT